MEIEVKKQLKNYGIIYLLYIDNVLFIILILVCAYAIILPSKRHKAVEKSSGKTSYIERFNNTLRQRISRLVRTTLSFSKKLENPMGAVWYFVHDYNSRLNLDDQIQ